MTGVRPGGRRRIDRLLGRDLGDLAALPLAELRALRDEALQEETDLSYLRRLLQGRLELITAELAGRRGGGAGDSLAEGLVADLPGILTAGQATRGPAHGLGRHRSVEPSRAGEFRRRVEAIVADVGLSDPGRRTETELERARETLAREEATVSGRRRAVQQVLDAAGAELARRYRDGEADVDALLLQGEADPQG